MNRRLLLIALAAATLLAGAAPLRSQGAAKATNVERLQKLKELNEKLIEQQTATLQKLDDLQKESQQLRILSRRT